MKKGSKIGASIKHADDEISNFPDANEIVNALHEQDQPEILLR